MSVTKSTTSAQPATAATKPHPRVSRRAQLVVGSVLAAGLLAAGITVAESGHHARPATTTQGQVLKLERLESQVAGGTG